MIAMVSRPKMPILFGGAFVLLLLLLPVPGTTAQGLIPDVRIRLDTDYMVADISTGKAVIVPFSGNVTYDGTVNTISLEVDACGFDTQISPEVIAASGDSAYSFAGGVTIPQSASLDMCAARIMASIQGTGVYPPPTVTTVLDIEIVKERLRVEVQGDDIVVMDQNLTAPVDVTFHFAVHNDGLTDDTITASWNIRQELRDIGWRIRRDEGDTVDIPARGFTDLSYIVTIPPNSEPGNYTFTLGLASTGSDSTATADVKVTVNAVNLPAPGGGGGEQLYLGMPFYIFLFTISIVVLGVCMMVVVTGTEIGFFAFLIWVVVPLYVKLKKEKILDNFTRGQIFGFIKANPGAHYGEIQSNMNIVNGVTAYHLLVLEREGFIRSDRDGMYKRFYPKAMKVPRKKKHLSRIQKDVLALLRKEPGLNQRAIAKELGESKQVVNYHIKALSKAGLVVADREGNETLCFLAEHKKAKDIDDERPIEVEVEPTLAD